MSPLEETNLNQLIERYLAGELSEVEAVQLNELLREDMQARAHFLNASSLHARLNWEYGSTLNPTHLLLVAEDVAVDPVQEESARKHVAMTRALQGDLDGSMIERGTAPGSSNFAIQSLARHRLAWVGLFAIAGAIALAIFLRPFDSSGKNLLARVSNMVQAKWGNQQEYVAGDQVFSGRMKLESGMAELEFTSGTRMILQAPVEVNLVSVDEAYLYSGQAVVHVEGHDKGFKVETPTATLLDLGTEFGVSVDSNGNSLLQVYDGEVLATLKEKPNRKKGALSQKPQLVKVGVAIEIDDELRDASFWPERFVRVLPDRNDPSDRGAYPYNVSLYDTIHIVPATAAPVIDADLSDWDLSGRFRSACVHPYGHNHYVEAAMMYDNKFLYVAAHVGDPYPMRSKISPDLTKLLYGDGGGIALRISTDRKLGWPLSAASQRERSPQPLLESDKNPKLNFLVLWHYQPDSRACLHIRSGMDLHDSKVNPAGYQGAYREDDDGLGYTLEYAIPWSLLNAVDDPPQAGDQLAAMFLVHWSDEAGEKWKGQLIDVKKPGEQGWNFDRAATWGKAIYHAEGRLPKGTVREIFQ
jgi:hypothetical protein